MNRARNAAHHRSERRENTAIPRVLIILGLAVAAWLLIIFMWRVLT